jgi:hypothetical protein
MIIWTLLGIMCEMIAMAILPYIKNDILYFIVLGLSSVIFTCAFMCAVDKEKELTDRIETLENKKE